jgi:hypothetical protein
MKHVPYFFGVVYYAVLGYFTIFNTLKKLK